MLDGAGDGFSAIEAVGWVAPSSVSLVVEEAEGFLTGVCSSSLPDEGGGHVFCYGRRLYAVCLGVHILQPPEIGIPDLLSLDRLQRKSPRNRARIIRGQYLLAFEPPPDLDLCYLGVMACTAFVFWAVFHHVLGGLASVTRHRCQEYLKPISIPARTRRLGIALSILLNSVTRTPFSMWVKPSSVKCSRRSRNVLSSPYVASSFKRFSSGELHRHKD